MRLRLLFEAFDAPLYHATSIDRFLSILKDNTFKMSETRRSTITINQHYRDKYPYYVSFARYMKSDYIELYTKHNKAYIVLEFDNRELKNNYKFLPADYNHIYKVTIDGERVKHVPFEAEERLLSIKKEIKNIRKYIKTIHTVLKEDMLNKVLEVKGDIPLYNYDSRDALLVTDKRKAKKY